MASTKRVNPKKYLAIISWGYKGLGMILQLNPSIPLNVTSKGDAYGRALFLIDYGENHSLVWVIGLENGELWCVKNEEVRLPKNWTMNYEEGR